MATKKTKPASAKGSSTTTTASANTDQMSTATILAASSAPEQTERDAVSSCLIGGLSAIGIKATTTTIIDFGAIDSDDLCTAMAHSIEQCLTNKGYSIAALSGTFITLRAQGKRLTVDALTTGLVGLIVSQPAAAGN